MILSSDSEYWPAFWRRRYSRRRMLTGAAAMGGALAAGAAVGCSGGDDGGATPAPTAAADATPQTGGMLRLPGFEAFVSDTLDPHQTQFGPIYSSHSAVFSKILRYEDAAGGVIATDLASAMPESPDGREYIIRLRPGVRVQRPSIALGRAATSLETAIGGREVTADDVVYSFQRQMSQDSPRRSYYYRSYQYDTFDSIEAVDAHTVRVVMKEPMPLALHYLADTNAFIVPAEAVDANDTMDSQDAMIGSGPFIWDRLQPLMESRFVRNPDWFGWDQPALGRPYLGGYISSFVTNDATIEASFRNKGLDAAIQVSNPRWIEGVRDQFPELQSRDVEFTVWLNSRLSTVIPPFNDFRVRRAIHLAMDRQHIIDSPLSGSGRLTGPVHPVLRRWALEDSELEALPGYRRDGAAREEDVREARALYEQAGSPSLHIMFADQPDYVPAFAPQVEWHLQETLGAEVTTEIRSYVLLAEGFARRDIGMSFQFDNGWIDPDEWLYPFFHSRGTKNGFGVDDPTLDSMLEAQRREFEEERRQGLVREIQRYLLDNVLARIDYASPINMWVAWPYYRNFSPSPFWGESFRLADAWLDRDYPSFSGRPG